MMYAHGVRPCKIRCCAVRCLVSDRVSKVSPLLRIATLLYRRGIHRQICLAAAFWQGETGTQAGIGNGNRSVGGEGEEEEEGKKEEKRGGGGGEQGMWKNECWSRPIAVAMVIQSPSHL